MAPNLVGRSGHVLDSFARDNAISRPISLRTRSDVRTEFIVNSIFNHLLERYGYRGQREDIISANHEEIGVLEALKKIVADFNGSYGERIVDLCSQLEVTLENARGVFLGVSNELFSEGITWARIATFFVFASELAGQCQQRELPDTVIDILRDSCLEYVQNSLENWIKDHGGWEGVMCFPNGTKSVENLPVDDAQSPGWAKSVLHGTVRILGTLAHIANSTGQIMALPIHNGKI